MQKEEDESFILTVRNTVPEKKTHKVTQTSGEKPAFVMKKIIVAHIILYPISILYIAIFYTLFLMNYRKCHYSGLTLPIVSFIISDILMLIAGIINLVSLLNRAIHLIEWGLTLVSVGFVSKLIGLIVFILEMKDCFQKRYLIIVFLCISIICLMGYWGFLHYLFNKIKKKPWKEVFLSGKS